MAGDILDPVRETKHKVEKPKMYKVVMLNDDFTPIDFVVDILGSIFKHNHEQAWQIATAVHQTGKGIAGTYTREIAETKATVAIDMAKQNGHPLMCVLEPEN